MTSCEALLRMPWSIDVEVREAECVLTVREIPGFFAAGDTCEHAAESFWDALESHLLGMLQLGLEVPRPSEHGLPGRTEPVVTGGPDPGRRTASPEDTGVAFEPAAA